MNRKFLITVGIGFFIVLIGVSLNPLVRKQSVVSYHYIVPGYILPESFDPLDADYSPNLIVARMRYLTPLEVSAQDELTSTVLESFGYDPKKREVQWIVRDGLQYHDNTPILSTDVAFAVARMAYTRPRFPVIEHIVGLEQWLKSKNPLTTLPNGIVVHDRTITIKFSRDVHHPLFRFCLELFSIIPQRCVDAKTNKLTCNPPPASGYYEIEGKGGKFISFSRRPISNSENVPMPERVQFDYISTAEALERIDIDNQAVLASFEFYHSPNELLNFYERYETRIFPSAWFSVFLLNPRFAAFRSKACRKFFAQEFRQAFLNIKPQPIQPSSSLFTKILPGYLPDNTLDAQSQNINNEAISREECLLLIRENPPKYAAMKSRKSSAFDDVMQQLYINLGIKPPPTPHYISSDQDLQSAYKSGDVAIVRSGSGFWALDPAGDLQMLFTPNLHAMFSDISRDTYVQKLIGSIKDAAENEEKSKYFARLNQYLYDEAIFNVYAHPKRFYLAKKGTPLRNLPMSITMPAPWQVFSVPQP